MCELPSWGTVLPPARVLDEIASVGFSGTELGEFGFFGATVDLTRSALRDRGLELVGAFCPLPLTDDDGGQNRLEGAVRLAETLAALNCHTLVAADSGGAGRREMAGRVASPHREWGRGGEVLARLAEQCRPLMVNVVFHPHAGTHVETETELDGLMAATPSDLVGLCLDTGHITYGGGDPLAVARRYRDRVRHVHLKDVSSPVIDRVRREGIVYEQAVGEDVFTPLGDGSVDFAALVDELGGYDGWWVLEQDVRLGAPWSDQDPAQNARRSLEYLRTLLK